MGHEILWKMAKGGAAAIAAALLLGGSVRAQTDLQTAAETETAYLTEEYTEILPATETESVSQDQTDMLTETPTEEIAQAETEEIAETMDETLENATEIFSEPETYYQTGTENFQEMQTETAALVTEPETESKKTEETDVCTCGSDDANAWVHDWDCPTFFTAFRMICSCAAESDYPFLHDDGCEGYRKAMGAVCTCDMQESCAGEAPYYYHEEDCETIRRIRVLLCDCGGETNDPEEHDGQCAYGKFLLGDDYEDDVATAANSGFSTLKNYITGVKIDPLYSGALLLHNGEIHATESWYNSVDGFTYYKISNTSKNTGVYAYFPNGASYDGEFLNVKMYIWLGDDNTYDSMLVYVRGDDERDFSFTTPNNPNPSGYKNKGKETWTDKWKKNGRNQIILEPHFYKQNGTEVSFYGLARFTDLDSESSMGNYTEGWAVKNNQSGLTFYAKTDTTVLYAFPWIRGGSSEGWDEKNFAWATFQSTPTNPVWFVYDARNHWESCLGGDNETISYQYANGSAKPVALPDAQIVTQYGTYVTKSPAAAAGYTVTAWGTDANMTGGAKETAGTVHYQTTSDMTYYVMYTPNPKVTLQKTNAVTGETIADAQFTVYEWDGSGYNKTAGVMEYRSDAAYHLDNLSITATNQGKYKVVETKTPDGFTGTWEKEFTVSSTASEANLTAENEMATGTISIVKKAKQSGEQLFGGVYTITAAQDIVSPGGQVLLKKGTAADTLTTKSGSVATSKKLYPGKYLVTETEAPKGYALDADPQEVIISCPDKDTANQDYPLVFENDRIYADIVLTKELDAEEIVWAHGNPVFTFCVKGTDVFGETHTYYGTVEFTSENVTAAEGKTALSTTIRVPAGVYTATEEKTMRYALQSIENVQNGSAEGEKAVLDLSDGQTGTATFYNTKTTDEDAGHTALVKNHIGA